MHAVSQFDCWVRVFGSTCNHSFSVSLFVWANSDKLLSQIWCYVSVAVHKDSDWLLQGDCCEVFDLKEAEDEW